MKKIKIKSPVGLGLFFFFFLTQLYMKTFKASIYIQKWEDRMQLVLITASNKFLVEGRQFVQMKRFPNINYLKSGIIYISSCLLKCLMLCSTTATTQLGLTSTSEKYRVLFKQIWVLDSTNYTFSLWKRTISPFL